MKTVNFRERSFTANKLPPNVRLDVLRYSNAAMGGPYRAEIRATGGDMDLWQLLSYLRCPVEIMGDWGDLVWWGYVAGIEITAGNPFSQWPGKTRVGVELDNMFNRIAVAWENISLNATGGARFTTAYSDDYTSQVEYGIKDALFSGESATDSSLATQARDILLVQKKFPVPVINLNASGESTALLHCRGWWDTLSWRQCTIPTELALSYSSTPTMGDSDMGTAAKEKRAQGILITGGNVNVSEIKIYIRKVAAPTDNVTIAIYGNPDDLTPTTLLETSSSVAGTALTTAYVETTFVITPYNMVSGQKYFMVIERSGAADDTNYYQIWVDSSAGYGAGTYVYYDGAWKDDSAWDMPFQIFQNAVIATSTQVVNIATKYGQFFHLVESEVASGITSESYRDGDGAALYEAEQLMRHGTTNNRRMLARVDASRRCTIYEEPAPLQGNIYSMYSNGSLFDPYGARVRDELASVGVYARLVDVIPSSVDATLLGNVDLRFLEVTEYNVQSGKLTYTARDELDPFEVGRPLDG